MNLTAPILKKCQNTISQWLILVEFLVGCCDGHTDTMQPKFGCYGKCPGCVKFMSFSTGLSLTEELIEEQCGFRSGSGCVD